MSNLTLPKLDIDALYDESEKRGSVGECPHCEFHGDTSEHILCYICGVCFKYHHGDYFHEPVNDYDDLP